MILKKRHLFTATLIIALCAALTVNWYFTKPQKSEEQTTGADEAVTGNLGDTLFVAGTTSSEGTTETDEDLLVNNDVKINTQTADSKEYFSDAKLKRTQSFDEAIKNIEKIIEKDTLDSSDKNKISVMLSDYKNDMKTQIDAENLISAKTGKESLVIINGDNCQVILEKNTLNEALILQISEIIEKNTDIFSENLTIIELK